MADAQGKRLVVLMGAHRVGLIEEDSNGTANGLDRGAAGRSPPISGRVHGQWGIRCWAVSPSRSLQLLARSVATGMTVSASLVVAAVIAEMLPLVGLLDEDLTYGDLLAGHTTWAAAWLALAGLLALGTLATGVAFVAWLYRARRNLDLESAPIAPPRWSPKWVLLAWLVPGGNLVLPAAVVTDVARASVGPRAVRLAWAWWASLLGSLLVLTAVLGTRLVRVVTAAQRSRLDGGVSAG